VELPFRSGCPPVSFLYGPCPPFVATFTPPAALLFYWSGLLSAVYGLFCFVNQNALFSPPSPPTKTNKQYTFFLFFLFCPLECRCFCSSYFFWPSCAKSNAYTHASLYSGSCLFFPLNASVPPFRCVVNDLLGERKPTPLRLFFPSRFPVLSYTPCIFLSWSPPDCPSKALITPPPVLFAPPFFPGQATCLPLVNLCSACYCVMFFYDLGCLLSPPPPPRAVDHCPPCVAGAPLALFFCELRVNLFLLFLYQDAEPLFRRFEGTTTCLFLVRLGFFACLFFFFAVFLCPSMSRTRVFSPKTDPATPRSCFFLPSF